MSGSMSGSICPEPDLASGVRRRHAPERFRARFGNHSFGFGIRLWVAPKMRPGPEDMLVYNESANNTVVTLVGTKGRIVRPIE